MEKSRVCTSLRRRLHEVGWLGLPRWVSAWYYMRQIKPAWQVAKFRICLWKIAPTTRMGHHFFQINFHLPMSYIMRNINFLVSFLLRAEIWHGKLLAWLAGVACGERSWVEHSQLAGLARFRCNRNVDLCQDFAKPNQPGSWQAIDLQISPAQAILSCFNWRRLTQLHGSLNQITCHRM